MTNADSNVRVVLDTGAMAWRETDGAEGDCKPLDQIDVDGVRETIQP